MIKRGEIEVHPKGAFVYLAYGPNDRLLYVGMTGNLLQRMASHGSNAGWWPMVTRIEWRQYATRAQARREEGRLIATMRPEWNVHGNDNRRFGRPLALPGRRHVVSISDRI